MRICLVADYLPGYHKIWGGSEVVCLNLAKILQNEGHEVLFLTSEFKKKSFPKNIFQIPSPLDKIAKIFPHFLFFLANLPLDIYSIFYSIFLLKKLKPDIIHFHGRKLFLPIMIASLIVKIPTVFTVLEYFILCPKIVSLKPGRQICKKFQGGDCAECILGAKSDYFLKRLVKKPILIIFSFLRPLIFRYFTEKLDAIVALTKTSKARLKKHGVPGKKIKVIYQYKINFKNNTSLFASRPQKEPLILFVGSGCEPHKGIDILIKALPDVIKEIPDTKLIAVGEPRNKIYETGVKSLISGLRLEENIKFVGQKKNEVVLKMILKSKVVAVPEQWQNDFGPVILLEAMALGRPVVASKIGATPEFIQDGYNGFLVKYNRPEQFAKRIVKLLRNENLASLMSKRAKKSANFLFGNDQIKQILKLYGQLIKTC